MRKYLGLVFLLWIIFYVLSFGYIFGRVTNGGDEHWAICFFIKTIETGLFGVLVVSCSSIDDDNK